MVSLLEGGNLSPGTPHVNVIRSIEGNMDAPEQGEDRDSGPWTATEKAHLALVVSVGLTLALYVLPFAHVLSWPLVLLSTVPHELGHGLAGLLVGGHFDSFSVWPDASGLAHLSYPSGVTPRELGLVSAGGLVGPACTAALGFVVARRELPARVLLVILGLGLAAVDVLLVHEAFGRLFVGGIAATLLGVGLRAPAAAARIVLVFLSVQLALSVYSRGDYLFTKVAETRDGTFPSDVANMATDLGGPYWFWGGVCAAFSALVLVLGLYLYVRGLPRLRRAAVTAAH
jgi:hypothetical protein